MRNALIMLVAAVLVVELAYLVYRRQQAAAPQAPAEVLQHLGNAPAATGKAPQNPRLGREYLRGLVRNEAGLPEAGCRVIVAKAVEARMHLARNARPPRWFETTDSTGRFALDTLPEGDFMVMALSDRAHDLRMVRVEHAGAVAEVLLRLRPSRTVSGHVYGPDGNPVSQARIFAVESDAGATGTYVQLPAISTAGGRFTISYLPDGPCRLLAVAEGVGTALTEVIPRDQPAVQIALSEGLWLRGRAELLEDGRPLSNVKLLLAEEAYGIERLSTRSDQNGEFTAGPLRPAKYQIQAAPGRYVLAQGTISSTLPQAGELRLKLVPAAYLRGRVLEAEGRRGVAGVRVTAVAADLPDFKQHVLSDSSGYYRIEGLIAGSYRLRAEDAAGGMLRPESGPAEAQAVAGKESKGPDFRRVAGRRLEGAVFDAAGIPVPNANVRAVAAGLRRGTRSGADGHFLLEGVPSEGLVRIRASVLDRVSVWYALTEQDLDGTSLSLTLAHTANCAIQGVAVNAQGAPVPEAYLRCMTPDDVLFTRADTQGRFRFEDLIPGEYHLAAGITETQAGAADPQSHLRLENAQRLTEVRVVIP